MKTKEPLNVTNEEFCNALGLPRRGDLMLQLRELQLVKFFKIGKKYMYPRLYIEKIQTMLLNGEIHIKTDKGNYYVTWATTSKLNN